MSEASDLWQTFQAAAARSATVPKRDTIQSLIDQLTELQALRGDGQKITSFFQNVGDGMVAAQRSLDTQAKEYNLGDPIQQKTFHVAKTSAQLKFAISSMSSEGFNIFIASEKDETKRVQEQEISFDIVTAPPPPDARLEGPKLADLIETNPDRRDEVLKRALRQTSRNTAIKALFAGMRLKKERILVFRNDDGWLLVRPDPDDGSTVESIHVASVPREGDPPRARAARAPSVQPLAQVLVRLVEWQATVL